MRSLVVLALAGSVLLAGCVGTDGAVDPDAIVAEVPADVPELVFDAATTVDDLITFVKAHPHRNTGQADHVGSRDWLEAELAATGLEVVRQAFQDPTRVRSVAAPDEAAVTLENIIGIKWGATDPNQWVIVGGHYDTVVAAVEGAYDDGSGTLMTIGLARAMQDLTLDRTVMFVLFDGEERGLRGSHYFADSVTDFYEETESEPFVYEGTIMAMVDLDMIGINHPAPPPIVFDDNSPEVRSYVLERAAQLGVPEDKLQCRGISAGRSDYASFEDAGIPVAFFISDFDDVWYGEYQVPRTYPFWHQMDTVETMTAMAGGHDMLVAGFQTAMDLSGGLVAHLAGTPGLLLSVESDDEAPPPRC